MSTEPPVEDGEPVLANRRDRDRQVTPTQWTELMAQLGPNELTAAVNYRRLHERLCRLFERRGFAAPEDLADVTLNRAAQALGRGVRPETGDLSAYVVGIAYNVFREVVREREREREAAEAAGRAHELVDHGGARGGDEDAYRVALRHCLAQVGEGAKLLLEYHAAGHGHRTRERDELAQRLGLAPNALRLRISRLRGKVERCLQIRLRKERTGGA